MDGAGLSSCSLEDVWWERLCGDALMGPVVEVLEQSIEIAAYGVDQRLFHGVGALLNLLSDSQSFGGQLPISKQSLGGQVCGCGSNHFLAPASRRGIGS